MTEIILVAGVTIFIFVVFFYIIALLLKNNSIIDIGWGLGLITVTAILHIFFPVLYFRKILVTLFVVLWGFRLSVYLFLRITGKPEDFRYADFRKKYGASTYMHAFFRIYIIQGIYMLILSYPVLLIFNSNPVDFTFWDALGSLIFLIGFTYEIIADYQLSVFRKSGYENGRLLQTGLWKLSRHPNYFGETLVWWGIYFIAVPTNYGWTGIISPLLITFLLIYVTGVPLIEAKLENKPGWSEYKKKTPKFFPNVF